MINFLVIKFLQIFAFIGIINVIVCQLVKFSFWLNIFPFLRKGVKETKQIVVSDADIVTNAVTKTTGPLPMGELPFEAFQFANKTFLLNAIDYLVNDNGLFESRNKVVVLRLLDKQKVVDQEKIWQLITTVGPVVLLLLIGLLVSFWRKKKYA